MTAKDNLMKDDSNDRIIKIYKTVSLFSSIIFGFVGLIFLVFPYGVLILFARLFNTTLPVISSIAYADFFVVLAVGYMYLVALLAYWMHKHPENKYFLLLLINGKSVSSLLSIIFYIFYPIHYILLVNFIVDGSIAVLFLFFYFKLKKYYRWD
jgi:L-cystine uptake protein TcyP (sodium:dicarboxylate symporter family)